MPNIRLSRARGPLPRLALKGAGAAAALTALLALAASPAQARVAVPVNPPNGVLTGDHLIARPPAAVVAYRVTYRTTNAAGRPVTASGLVAFPQNPTRQLRVVEYEHGTIADKADVPSSFGLDAAGDGVEGRWAAELFASAGFAVAEPDYVGLGQSPGRPEYMVAASELSASLGLLRAAAQLAGAHGHQLNRGVLMTGFSQGGGAAMAVGRALQDRAGSPFEPL